MTRLTVMTSGVTPEHWGRRPALADRLQFCRSSKPIFRFNGELTGSCDARLVVIRAFICGST